MKIVKIEAIPLRGRGEQGAYGAPYGLVTRVTTDAGIVGYGETDSMPTVVKAVIEAPYLNGMMSGLAALLIGQDPTDTNALWHRMAQGTLNYSRDGVTVQAMAALDIALWDIKGKAAGQPVHELLGGARRKSVRAYASHPLGRTLDDTAQAALCLRRAGFTAVKFGWAPLGPDADRDEAIVRGLREAIGEEAELLLDGGLAWDAETAIERCHRFQPYRLFWLEEPLAPYDFAGYAKLTSSVPTMIAAGELASTTTELARLIQEGGLGVAQVDISRVGLTQAMAFARFSARLGIPCVNHTYSYDINLAASLHFAAVIELTSLFEYQMTPNEIRDSLVSNRPRPKDSMIDVPEGPGLGIEIDEAALERFRVRD